jgi:hypothetical protein
MSERNFQMICQTVKTGIDCGFMTKKGCGFKGGACHPIIDQCSGCAKVMDCAAEKYCKIYPEPAAKWLSGKCAMATNIKTDVKEAVQKVNPLKASKRANKK